MFTTFAVLGQPDSSDGIKIDVTKTLAALKLSIANAIGSSPSEMHFLPAAGVPDDVQFEDDNRPVVMPSASGTGKVFTKCIIIPNAVSSRELDITLPIYKWKGSTEILTTVHVAAMLTTNLRELVRGAEQQVQASRGSSSVLWTDALQDSAVSTVKEAILAGYITSGSLKWEGSAIFAYDKGCTLQLQVKILDSLEVFQLPGMESSDTVADLKNKIQGVVDIPYNQQNLFYDDGVKVSWMPSGQNATVESSCRPNTLHLWARLQG